MEISEHAIDLATYFGRAVADERDMEAAIGRGRVHIDLWRHILVEIGDFGSGHRPLDVLFNDSIVALQAMRLEVDPSSWTGARRSDCVSFMMD